MSLIGAILSALLDGNQLAPKIFTSSKYKHWISVEDWRRCLQCKDNHGKIWLVSESPTPNPPVHAYCRCAIVLMQSIQAGTATIDGVGGADWTLLNKNLLPDYYLSQVEFCALGWSKGKSPAAFAPGKTMFNGIFKNKNGHLPQSDNRIWYEADINYTSGNRNSQRIVWSNDGLVFVTYDHYKTFYEIV